MDALVIGAGVIGASVALRLARSGANVTVVEAQRAAAGTSSTSFAWISACEKIGSEDYFRLSLAAVEAHRDAAAEFELGDRFYRRDGVIQWDLAEFEDPAAESSAAERKFERLMQLGYPAELVGAADLARLEPALAPDALEGGGAIHYPQDGYLDAPLYVGAMLEAACHLHRAKLRQQAPVAEVLLSDDAAIGVRLESGEILRADVVVNCAGHLANSAAGQACLTVPQAPTLGLIAYTAPAAVAPRRVLRIPRLNLRPDGGGRLLLRANDLDRLVGRDDRPDAAHPVARKLAERLYQLVPALEGTPIEAVRIATRPIPKDGLPAIGPVPGIANYWMAVTHGGINLAAFLGKALCDEIMHQRPAAELAPFRPSRFFPDFR